MILSNIKKLKYIASITLLCGGIFVGTLHAQDDIDVLAEMEDSNRIEIVKLPKPPISQLKPLFWMPEELNIINQIKRGVIQVVPIDESEIQGGLLDDTMEDAPIPTLYLVPRDLKLSGIVYNTSEDWSLWINGVKVTPDKQPKEIRHLSVYEDFIEIKWFDAQTNKIYPVRMRPYQRFNIDTGRFLPL